MGWLYVADILCGLEAISEKLRSQIHGDAFTFSIFTVESYSSYMRFHRH